MSGWKKLALPVLLIAVLVTVAYLEKDRFFAEKSVTASPAVELQSRDKEQNILRFPANAPQLSYLKIAEVNAWPEPLVEPLNARVSYNDNVTARVFSPVAGRVSKICIEPGQRVKAGEKLAVLESPDYAAVVSENLKAEANLLRARQAYDRAKSLYEAKGLALRELEAEETNWHQAEAEAAQSRIHVKNLGGVSAEGEFVLRAPVSGVVSERQINIGSEVKSDATLPLFVITNPDKLWVQIDLPEKNIGKVKIDQQVEILADAYPEASFSGKVTNIAGALDPLTRRIQVRCDVVDPSHRLMPEMYVRVTPIADEKTVIPRIPNAALVTQGENSYVFVEISPGVLERRQVTLSLQSSDYAYIREGLKAGERIVTSGALLLNSELSGVN